MDNSSTQQLILIDSAAENNEFDNADRVSSSLKKRANELDGKTWTRYSISVWSDIRKNKVESQLGHPAIFPVALALRLIEIFTNSEQNVIFDPFAGVGSTLVAAQESGKNGIGIELNPEFAELAKRRFAERSLGFQKNGSASIYIEDAVNLHSLLKPKSVDLVITSPPYWDILNMKRSADYKELRNYGDESRDLGKIKDYEGFLSALEQIFRQVYDVMKVGAYCCVIVMDIRKKNKFYPFHSDIAVFMEKIGFIYDDIIIWDRRHEYNNMRPLGYPSVFRVNKAHEFILIFQKARG